MDAAASSRHRTWLVSKTQPPFRRKIIPLASPNKRVIFALQLKLPAASCRESSTERNVVFFMIRSLPPPQAAGTALAFAVQFELRFGFILKRLLGANAKKI
jgi:hypothetical protein